MTPMFAASDGDLGLFLVVVLVIGVVVITSLVGALVCGMSRDLKRRETGTFLCLIACVVLAVGIWIALRIAN